MREVVKMHVEKVEWREGEIEVVVVDRDERAMKIEHTLNYYISIVVGHEEARGYVTPLWEIRCEEPKSCYMCVRIPLDPSVCVDVGDFDTVKEILKRMLRQLDEIEVDVVVRKVLEKVKECIEEVVKE